MDNIIDQKLTQLEHIVDGRKAAEENKVNQEFYKELEKDKINALAIIGTELLLENARRKGASDSKYGWKADHAVG